MLNPAHDSVLCARAKPSYFFPFDDLEHELLHGSQQKNANQRRYGGDLEHRLQSNQHPSLLDGADTNPSDEVSGIQI